MEGRMRRKLLYWVAGLVAGWLATALWNACGAAQWLECALKDLLHIL